MSQLLAALATAQASALERRLEEARYFVGIDLGTTSSSLVVVDAQTLVDGNVGEAVRVLRIRQEMENEAVDSPFLSSAVAQVDSGVWWVGQGARQLRGRGHVRDGPRPRALLPPGGLAGLRHAL